MTESKNVTYISVDLNTQEVEDDLQQAGSGHLQEHCSGRRVFQHISRKSHYRYPAVRVENCSRQLDRILVCYGKFDHRREFEHQGSLKNYVEL